MQLIAVQQVLIRPSLTSLRTRALETEAPKSGVKAGQSVFVAFNDAAADDGFVTVVAVEAVGVFPTDVAKLKTYGSAAKVTDEIRTIFKAFIY